jgi:hypothetical protein
MGRVAKEYATLASYATVGDGLAVQGEEARRATNDVDTWLRRVQPPPSTVKHTSGTEGNPDPA